MKNFSNNAEENSKPLIFTKKVNNKYKTIPLNITTNTVGATRHFPSATKEWFNSIYAYNNNAIKNFSVADKNFSELIKSYFNLYFARKIAKGRRIAIRFRRLSLKKIFISKAELKHTSSKVIITLYIYNEERRLLISKLSNLTNLLYSSVFSIDGKLDVISSEKGKLPLLNYLEKIRLIILKKVSEEEFNKNYSHSSKRKLIMDNLNSFLKNIDETIIICKNYDTLPIKWDKFYEEIMRKTELEIEIMTLAYYKLLLDLNKSKFENGFLSRLKPLVSKIYNKEVEFNIVNLKTLYLNSDIFTEAIAIKMKNRDNKLLKIFKSSLNMVELPNVNRIREKYGQSDTKDLFINKVKNTQIRSLLSKNEDGLNRVLFNIFSGNFINDSGNKVEDSNTLAKPFSDSTVQDSVLNSLKYKTMAGARLEAKGRLTKRFTASRSVFKLK